MSTCEQAPALVSWMETLGKADHLAPVLADLTSWPYPKSDLYHWIPLLNRMDTALEGLVAKYGLATKAPGSVVAVGADGTWKTDDKAELLAILKLSTFLWENCTNRSLYASYEVSCPQRSAK